MVVSENRSEYVIVQIMATSGNILGYIIYPNINNNIMDGLA